MTERDAPHSMDAVRNLMLREMQLRVVNNLALVSAVATQCLLHTRNTDVARAAVAGRIEAMAKANTALMRLGAENVSVADVVRGFISAFDMAPGRFSLSGARVDVSANAALTLLLVMNELGSNAARYGALSNGAGRVLIEWSLERVTGDFTLSWMERGGPAVVAPKTDGLGWRLIDKAFVGSLRGRTQIEFDREGVTCVLVVPLDQLIAE